MSQEIEIEFKTLLHQERFEQLLQALPFPRHAKTQTNHYFETEHFNLKEKRCALRIREKEGSYTLTLKQPHPEGILETHDSLAKDEYTKWVQGHPVRKEYTGQQLDEMDIAVNNLKYYGYLTTERYSFEQNNIIYVLDKSFYHHAIDYELEIESMNYADGEHAFSKLLTDFRITRQTPISKTERFFKAIGEQT